MPDKRTVDELSIEELERVLAIKKRQARQDRLQKMKQGGRVIDVAPPPLRAPAPVAPSNAPTRVPVAGATPQFDEEDVPLPLTQRKRADDSLWQRFLDRSLLLVEVVAVLGLVVIGFVMLGGIDTLQRETAQAQQLAEAQNRASVPTIAPTPTLNIANVVLPGGHTPPNREGGGQFNFDEIPSNLRAQLRDQIFLPPEIARPPILPQTPLRIIIPDLNVDQSIVQGVDWEALKLGVGQLPNGATPADDNGNVVLAAHNDIYGEIFRHLDRLKPGMYFQIQTQTQIYTYVVTGSDIVDPSAVEVMESRGYASATLISCYPYQVNTQRIIIFAERVNT